eukprot:3266964-Rhodomonas_salina.1
MDGWIGRRGEEGMAARRHRGREGGADLPLLGEAVGLAGVVDKAREAPIRRRVLLARRVDAISMDWLCVYIAQADSAADQEEVFLQREHVDLVPTTHCVSTGQRVRSAVGSERHVPASRSCTPQADASTPGSSIAHLSTAHMQLESAA